MKATVEVMTCDRCGGREEIRSSHRGYLWGRMNAAQSNGPHRIGSVDGREFKDLCPDCIASLLTWWKVGRPTAEKAA